MAELLGREPVVARHAIARLDRLAVGDPAHHRAAMVGQNAGAERQAAADMGEVRAGKAVRLGPGDAVARGTPDLAEQRHPRAGS